MPRATDLMVYVPPLSVMGLSMVLIPSTADVMLNVVSSATIPASVQIPLYAEELTLSVTFATELLTMFTEPV